MEGSDLAGAKRPRRKNEGGRKAEVLSSYVRIGSELTIWPSSCVRSEQGRGRRKEEGRGRRKEGAGGKRPRTKKKSFPNNRLRAHHLAKQLCENQLV